MAIKSHWDHAPFNIHHYSLTRVLSVAFLAGMVVGYAIGSAIPWPTITTQLNT